MSEYPKIQTIFFRDPATKNKKLLLGHYSLPEFEYLSRLRWEFTEKVDGTNIRIEISGKGLTFKGKTEESQLPAKLVAHLEEVFLPINDALNAAFPEGAVLYGEGHGAGIQAAGKFYGETQQFVLFDARVGEWWLKRKDIENVATTFNLSVVPVIGHGDLHEMVEMVRAGFQSAWGPFVAEGIVARPIVELRTRSGERIITKLKHKDF